MNKISAVIITYNEERNIARCLDSLKDVADEIVVLDSFSTDGTEEICRQKKAVFIQHEWIGYASSKNIANEKASNDWILSIDADEALSEMLIDSILKIKNQLSDKFYSFNRLTNYCGTWIKHSGWYPDRGGGLRRGGEQGCHRATARRVRMRPHCALRGGRAEGRQTRERIGQAIGIRRARQVGTGEPRRGRRRDRDSGRVPARGGVPGLKDARNGRLRGRSSHLPATRWGSDHAGRLDRCGTGGR